VKGIHLLTPCGVHTLIISKVIEKPLVKVYKEISRYNAQRVTGELSSEELDLSQQEWHR